MTELDLNWRLHVHGGHKVQVQAKSPNVVGKVWLKRTLFGKVAETLHDISAQAHKGHLIAIRE